MFALVRLWRFAVAEFLKCGDRPKQAHGDNGDKAQEEALGWRSVNQPLFQLDNPTGQIVGKGMGQVWVGADKQKSEQHQGRQGQQDIQPPGRYPRCQMLELLPVGHESEEARGYDTPSIGKGLQYVDSSPCPAEGKGAEESESTAHRKW